MVKQTLEKSMIKNDLSCKNLKKNFENDQTTIKVRKFWQVEVMKDSKIEYSLYTLVYLLNQF